MIVLTDDYLLMIEPDREGKPSLEPVEDELTAKVDYIFSVCKPSEYATAGFHKTKCGRCSDNVDWILPNKMITNRLCTYYIRYYRNYIPQSEINKINRVYSALVNE